MDCVDDRNSKFIDLCWIRFVGKMMETLERLAGHRELICRLLEHCSFRCESTTAMESLSDFGYDRHYVG